MAEGSVQSTDERLRLLRDMEIIREFENMVGRLSLAGKTEGLVHLMTGQEAVAVGAIATLRAEDYISLHHRAHGHCIVKGGEMARLFGDLLGKSNGYALGRGGSPHFYDAASRNMGTNAIVGASVPMATGAALSAKVRQADEIAMAFFGDGVLNQGIMFESVNMAAIWNLPVVYICEDNKYGEFTEGATVTAGDYLDRGRAFGIPTYRIDGMDVLEVRAHVQAAVDRARAGDGPSFLICDTYRFTGHHVHDTQDYKDDAEMQAWLARDPIPRLRSQLLDAGAATAAELEALSADVKREVDEALAVAEAAPDPQPEDLWSHLYA